MKTVIAGTRTAKKLAGDTVSRIKLGGILQRLGRTMTRNQMAYLVEDAPSQCSRVMTGHLTDLSADRMIAWLNELGCNVTITVTKNGRRTAGKTKVVYVEV